MTLSKEEIERLLAEGRCLPDVLEPIVRAMNIPYNPTEGCQLCRKSKEEWQVFCGAACCAAFEQGTRWEYLCGYCKGYEDQSPDPVCRGCWGKP